MEILVLFPALIQLFMESVNLVEGGKVAMEIVTMLYAVFRVACIQNEPNRHVLAQSDVISRTLALLSLLNLSSGDVDHASKCLLVRHSCRFLRAMTLDDDMNVVFGLGSENARQIASTNAAIEIFLRLLRASLLISNQRCLVDLFLTLTSVITREEFCTQFRDLGGIEIIFGALEEYIDSPKVASACLVLLRALCNSDDCKRTAGLWQSNSLDGERKTTGPGLIVDVLERYIRNVSVAKNAAAVIATLTLRQPDLADLVISAGAAEFLAKALQLHISDSATVRAVCMAIRNCVARSTDLRAAFVGDTSNTDNGAMQCYKPDHRSDPYELEALLNIALQSPDCADEAKAALRDLGLTVRLRELWQGNPVANL
ncbi:Armadillo repeat-containing protein 6 [Paragonimus westermani]|uniref:Armadillo repeat-containing protein 6 n=1 Tax=Paragonimus westermani TaxID=34504 RepID=A0A8T0D757_9TREM|nr:Armadillo repeat-containing protein 6 [Paragonimus westermani]